MVSPIIEEKACSYWCAMLGCPSAQVNFKIEARFMFSILEVSHSSFTLNGDFPEIIDTADAHAVEPSSQSALSSDSEAPCHTTKQQLPMPTALTARHLGPSAGEAWFPEPRWEYPPH